MKIINLALTSLQLTLLFSYSSNAYFEYCPNYSKSQQEAANYFSSLVSVDLLSYLETETNLVRQGRKGSDASFTIVNKTIDALKARPSPLSISEVRQELSNQSLLMLENYTPNDLYDSRLDFLTEDIVRAVLNSIENHPIVSSDGMMKYDQKGTKIGYCFGRATYVDLILARLGVNQDSIKKIWAVGPMSAGGINWQFHVGTLVRLKDNRWVVIDNVVGEIIEARDWYKYFLKENQNNDLRVYITDSNKFTPSLGVYSRQQLGLNLLRATDWYQGYFTDLMKWFQEYSDNNKLAKFLGLKKLPDRPLPGAT